MTSQDTNSRTRAPFSSYEDVGWHSSIVGGKDYKGVPVKGRPARHVLNQPTYTSISNLLTTLSVNWLVYELLGVLGLGSRPRIHTVPSPLSPQGPIPPHRMFAIPQSCCHPVYGWVVCPWQSNDAPPVLHAIRIHRRRSGWQRFD